MKLAIFSTYAIPIVILGLLSSCGKKSEMANLPPAMPVKVAQPLKKSIVDYAEFTGRLAAVDHVDIKPRVSGYIDSIHFKEGQKVAKGDLLFVIDQRPFKAQVNQFKARVNQAKAAKELADTNLQRAKELIASRSISAEQVDIRESEALQAQADLKAIQAELDAIELNLEFTEVRSPIDGIADRHFVTQGNLVTGDVTSLTTVVSYGAIYAYYDVDERSFLRGMRQYFDGEEAAILDSDGVMKRGFEQGIPAYLGLDDEEGFPHQGVIDFASNQLNPSTATMTIRAKFANKDQFLTPGLFARIKVPVSKEQERLLIPDSAIGSDQSLKYVWVVAADNTPQRRNLVIGSRYEGYRIVEQGLEPDERIVIEGIQFIRPGIVLAPQDTEI